MHYTIITVSAKIIIGNGKKKVLKKTGKKNSIGIGTSPPRIQIMQRI